MANWLASTWQASTWQASTWQASAWQASAWQADADLLLAALWGYWIGAVPTGVIVARIARGVDVRATGSGHTGGTNVARVAGKYAGLCTVLVDMLLGFCAVAGAMWITGNVWATVLAGVLAVIGHDWSAFIRFGGGIGLAKFGGGMVALWTWQPWITALVVLGVWVWLIKKRRAHRARSTILVMMFVGPLLWLLGTPLYGIVQGVACALVVIVKTLPDWQRVYA